MEPITFILHKKLFLNTARAKHTNIYEGLVEARIRTSTWKDDEKSLELNLNLHTDLDDTEPQGGKSVWTSFPTLNREYLHLSLDAVVEKIRKDAQLCFRYDKGPNGPIDGEYNKFITSVRGIPFCWNGRLWSTCYLIREYIAYVP